MQPKAGRQMERSRHMRSSCEHDDVCLELRNTRLRHHGMTGSIVMVQG
jgi:hypothetical protein